MKLSLRLSILMLAAFLMLTSAAFASGVTVAETPSMAEAAEVLQSAMENWG